MESNNNKTLAQIMDEIASEDTQGLIKKDLLLDTDYTEKEDEN